MWRNVSKKTGKSKGIPGDLRFSAAFKAQSQNLAIYLVMTESSQDFLSKPWMVRIIHQGKTLAWEAVQRLFSAVELGARNEADGLTVMGSLTDKGWQIRDGGDGAACWKEGAPGRSEQSSKLPRDCPAVSTVMGLTGATTSLLVSP